jgi:hypothetical protein
VNRPECSLRGPAPPDYSYTTAHPQDMPSVKRGSFIAKVPRDHQVEGGAVSWRGIHVPKYSYKYEALTQDKNSIQARDQIF